MATRKKAVRGSDVLLETWRTRPGISDELVQGIVEATRELDSTTSSSRASRTRNTSASRGR